MQRPAANSPPSEDDALLLFGELSLAKQLTSQLLASFQPLLTSYKVLLT